LGVSSTPTSNAEVHRLEAVTMPDDLIDRVLEISLAGEEITLDLYDLPQDPPA
jgi:hypothetical protein